MSRVTSAGLALTFLALSVLATSPASAQAPGSWALTCKGNAAAHVSWEWLADGAPISGASGSATCATTATITGTSVPPANANGLTVTLSVTAGDNFASKTTTKSFDPTKSTKVTVSVSSSDRFCVQIFPYPTCITWVNDHEGAQFSLEV